MEEKRVAEGRVRRGRWIDRVGHNESHIADDVSDPADYFRYVIPIFESDNRGFAFRLARCS
jgi:adenosylmethionine-8-amino-7-oxononanoate aminotransferase